MVRVQNAIGTSNLTAPNGFSWLEYWEYHKGRLKKNISYNCPACGDPHYRKDFVGAHVQVVGDRTRRLYIIPLCEGCNHINGSFYVDEKLLLATA